MRRISRRSLRIDWQPLEDRAVPATLIAIVDSGVDINNGAMAPYYDFTYAYNANTKQQANANHSLVHSTGHGMYVANNTVQAIIDTKNQPGAEGADVKIMPIVGDGYSSRVRGIFWAADHGAAVINLSAKWENYMSSIYDPGDPLHGKTLAQAIQYAQAKGAIVVTAPGNDQKNIDANSNVYAMPASADDPAYNQLGLALTNVLVAAAVDVQGNLSWQSNWGPIHVDLGAYGSTDGATSYSAAYTSGVSGVIAALTPSWSAAQRINHIKQTVQPRAQSVGNWSTTNGLISPANAVAALPIYSSTVDRTAEAGGIVTARGENAPNETKAKAFDNNSATKWLDFSGTSWLQYQFANNASRVITQYTITSAADTASFPGRAPKNWVLKASNDGTTWTTLDTRTNEADTANLHAKTYNFFNDTAYKMYRLDSIVSNGDPTIQIAEVRLKGPATLPRTPGDFDGDGKADFSAFGTASDGARGFTTVLSTQNYDTNSRFLLPFGPVGGISTVADYDGDGRADYSIFGDNGQGGYAWYWISSRTGAQRSQNYGYSGGIPVTADFDGDGKSDFSIYGQNSNGVWGFSTLLSSYDFNINNQSGFNFNGAGYGWSQSMPLAGDFDGDGKADYSLYAPNGQGSNNWSWISSITGLQNGVTGYGGTGSVPLAADFDGDGRSDFSVYGQNSNGVWGFSTLLSSYNFSVANQSGFNFNGAGYGWSGAIPSVADYNGDGKADYSLFSPSTYSWSWISSNGGSQAGGTIPGMNQDFMPITSPFITRFRRARGLG